MAITPLSFSPQVDPKDGPHLELEDYLGGLILMSNELVKSGETLLLFKRFLNMFFNFSPGPLHREQRDPGRLLEAYPHLWLHQRPPHRVQAAQPEERPPQEEVRLSQVRHEEGGGGRLRPQHQGTGGKGWNFQSLAH